MSIVINSVVFLFSYIFCSLVIADVSILQQCNSIQDRDLRLACYDSLSDFNEVLNEEAIKAADTPVVQENTQHVMVGKLSDRRVNETSKLSSNKPNFFGFAFNNEQGSLQDDNHLELNISIKYPLLDKSLSRIKTRWSRNDEWENKLGTMLLPDKVYFVYNGTYDFYAFESDRYNSAPIVSRHQNPGLLVGEWQLSRDADIGQYLRVGWFHESNGQSVEPRNQQEFDLLKNEPDEDGGIKGREYALSKISRGWDYLQIRYEASSDVDRDQYAKKGWWHYYIDLHLYNDKQFFLYDREDEVLWDPSIVNQPKIRDYDGLRVMGEWTFAEHYFENFSASLMMRAELKTGISDSDALSNYGGKFSLIGEIANTRIAAFYFDGYGKEPSTYHLKTSYFGLGLELR